MASTDSLREKLKGIVAAWRQRIQERMSSSEEEEAASSASQNTKTRGKKKSVRKVEEDLQGRTGGTASTMVTKTKTAVEQIRKLLALIREASGREKDGKIAFLREDQVAVRNATFDIQTEVQQLMLLILESGESARVAEEGRRRADKEAKKAIEAAKVSATIVSFASPAAERKQVKDNAGGRRQENNNVAERESV